jgi:hypothetical protein
MTQANSEKKLAVDYVDLQSFHATIRNRHGRLSTLLGLLLQHSLRRLESAVQEDFDQFYQHALSWEHFLGQANQHASLSYVHFLEQARNVSALAKLLLLSLLLRLRLLMENCAAACKVCCWACCYYLADFQTCQVY